jgi:AcrR family transcriptional regulator
MRTSQTSRRDEATEALLDAAERLLVESGAAGLTTRQVAAEAGLNHGLVHYYFGSIDNLVLAVGERFTDRLIARQRAMYGEDVPFREKWSKAMGYLGEDLAAGYPKVAAELSALAWNDAELRKRVRRLNERWRTVLREAFAEAIEEYGLDEREYPLDAVVSLVMTFNIGLQTESLLGIEKGHAELLAWIDGWLADLEKRAGR